jgi:hypothetical protein
VLVLVLVQVQLLLVERSAAVLSVGSVSGLVVAFIFGLVDGGGGRLAESGIDSNGRTAASGAGTARASVVVMVMDVLRRTVDSADKLLVLRLLVVGEIVSLEGHRLGRSVDAAVDGRRTLIEVGVATRSGISRVETTAGVDWSRVETTSRVEAGVETT